MPGNELQDAGTGAADRASSAAAGWCGDVPVLRGAVRLGEGVGGGGDAHEGHGSSDDVPVAGGLGPVAGSTTVDGVRCLKCAMLEPGWWFGW
jgi:hypothetical protein